MRLIDAPRVSNHLISQVARAREQTPRLDGPAFPNSRHRTNLSFGRAGQSAPSRAEKRGCQWLGKSNSGSPLTELDGETRLLMVTKIMEWVSITALLMAISCQHKGPLGQDLAKVFVQNTRA